VRCRKSHDEEEKKEVEGEKSQRLDYWISEDFTSFFSGARRQMVCLGIVMTVGTKSFVGIVSEPVRKAVHGVEEVLPSLTCNHTAQDVASFMLCDIVPHYRQITSLHMYLECASASYCHSRCIFWSMICLTSA
jgi:hypothetical protein